MAKSTFELADLFQMASRVLGDNRQALNSADAHNGNHGDNMVEIFELLANAMQEKRGQGAGETLAHATRALEGGPQSGSARLYREAISGAAEKFKSSEIDAGNGLDFVQTLLGIETGAPESGSPVEEAIGSLLQGLGGGMRAGQTQSGGSLDSSDLLGAGLAFLHSQGRGGSVPEALLEAMLSKSRSASSPHRAASARLIGEVLLKALAGLDR